MTLLQDRIKELEIQHGSLRAAARVLITDPGYLSRLKIGISSEPSDLLLKRMGLRRVVKFVRINKSK